MASYKLEDTKRRMSNLTHLSLLSFGSSRISGGLSDLNFKGCVVTSVLKNYKWFHGYLIDDSLYPVAEQSNIPENGTRKFFGFNFNGLPRKSVPIVKTQKRGFSYVIMDLKSSPKN